MHPLALQAFEWQGTYLRLLDQSRLPAEIVHCQIRSAVDAYNAITTLKVRGAPAIGITAAYGLYLGMLPHAHLPTTLFLEELERGIAYLASSRRTGANLSYALARVRAAVSDSRPADSKAMLQAMIECAAAIHREDAQVCERLAKKGEEVIPSSACILTYCNTGALATGGSGTALGLIRRAHEVGKNISVVACETRPVLQGARLTVWELRTLGIDVCLICDNMAAALMQARKIDLVLVGADCIAANGGFANKVGTYSLAVLAKYHHVPFYVAAPVSSIDFGIITEQSIVIEVRPENEVRMILGKLPITVPGTPCWNPAFDVTPPELISGIITERGIIRHPLRENLAALKSSQT